MSVLFSSRYLFWTNTALGGSFLVAADTLEQQIRRYLSRNQEQEKGVDLKRTKAMAGGGLLFGSLGHFWYAFLDKRFPGKLKSTVAKKLACEAAAGPPFLYAIFTCVGTLEGKTWMENNRAFRKNLLFGCLADWGFYVPLQFVNFYYLPPKYRFLFVAFITLFYDTFLSFLLHRPLDRNEVRADETLIQKVSGS